MGVKVAVNGFGRIGRYIVRLIAKETRDIECLAINSRADSATLAHLLEYDSVHGHYDVPIKYDSEALIVGGRKILISRRIGDWSTLPWGELGVDIVLETSGKFPDEKACQKHLKAGAKKVIIGAPGKGPDTTLVMGVNHEEYDPRVHHVISNGSCTTNCLAPAAKVIHQTFGIERGLMTTVHSYTMGQRILDGSHKDLRRARAAAMSIVPTTTGAARSIALVIPELQGRLDGLSLRVPTPNVSIVDLVTDLSRPVSVADVNSALKEAGEKELKGILKYSEAPLVSVDYTSSPYSSIVDAPLTNVIGDKMVKVMLWYDNESGFAGRMVDMALYIGDRL